MNRIETEFSSELQVIRLDVRASLGAEMSKRLGCQVVPTFILFDGVGDEEWRSVGWLDIARVRSSLKQMR